MLTKILSFFLAIFSILTFDPLSKYDYSDKMGNEDYTGLKECYSDYFDMGAAVAGWHCLVPEYAEFILKNYSSLTAENAFKQAALNPAEGVWNFSEADTIANFCRENGLKLRGHCLVWGALDNWMPKDSDGNLVSKDVLLQRMHDYISTVVNRYKDIVRVWDVVNEPFGYDKKTGAFKQNAFYEICGEEYVTKAFEFAHEADPTATLCLNETTIVKNKQKEKYTFMYLEKWLNEGVPINAVGLQSHWNLFEPTVTPKRLQKIIDKLYNMGLEIQITECDLNINATENEIFETVPRTTDLLQAKKMSKMFEVLRKNSDKITSVTFWGVSDDRTFRKADGSVYYKSALLFDKDYKPKNAFFAVCDF